MLPGGTEFDAMRASGARGAAEKNKHKNKTKVIDPFLDIGHDPIDLQFGFV